MSLLRPVDYKMETDLPHWLQSVYNVVPPIDFRQDPTYTVSN